ncbi:MAG: hypothetical protein ACK4UY_05755 [Dietzia sp.]
MTTSPQAYRPDDLTARIIVAAGGAFVILVLAIIGFAVSDSWIPGTLVLFLIPVHVVLAITDTDVLDDPRNAGARATTELRRLAGGGVLGSGFTHPGGAPPSVDQGGHVPAPTAWGPPPATNGSGAGDWPVDPGWESERESVPESEAGRESPPTDRPSHTIAPAPPSPRIPLGADRGFEPPGPGRPSTVHGFGSYGTQDHHPRPAAEPSDPPVSGRAETAEPESHHDDDPDMTIQRPPKDP